jgi:Uma2 family endonuclease
MPAHAQALLPTPRTHLRTTREGYVKFCEVNPDLRVELSAEGEIVFMPPAGGESDYRSNRVSAQLDRWAEEDGRGKAFGSSAQFFLPDGSGLSPDAAWVSNQLLKSMPHEQLQKFPPLCPEFVVEVLSPSDKLKIAKEKMEQWIANGVQLGWLIDGDRETVYVYRRSRPTQIHRGIAKLAGDGPVKGFRLQMRSIWQGLK